MNSNDLKKIAIVLLIILLIIIVGILMIKNYLNRVSEKNKVGESEYPDLYEEYGKTLSGGVNSDAYFDIKKCIQEYLNAINVESSRYSEIVNENEIKQKIYNLLSNKYIQEKNLTVDNLYTHIQVLNEAATFVPIELSLIQDGETRSYLVHGLIQSQENSNIIGKIFAVVNINIMEYKFSIHLIDGEYKSINEITIDDFEDNTITANEENEFFQAYVDDQDIPKEYIKIFKGLALGAPERLYNLLNEEYRNAKFGNLEEFKKYIEKNKAQIMTAQLQKYQINVNENKLRYICIDGYDNYYIIYQDQALAEYSIMLDTYTIDLPEFKEKYDKSENNLKMALNVQKLVKATKDGDFKYVYSKLNDTFKSTNFGTQENFEKYIQEKYDPRNDTIKYDDYEEKPGVHIYNIKVTKKKENKTIDAKVVMKLKENRDFELSFSANN